MWTDAVATFALPIGLARDGYALREESDSDLPFLQALYATTRQVEMAVISAWSDMQKLAFLAQQFRAQREHYRTRIADCRFAVIERRGTPMGRLYLQTRATHVHVVDITLLTEARGRGLGTAILQAVIDTAHAGGYGVSLVVERGNPALHLYQRLGFTPLHETDLHIELACTPTSTRVSPSPMPRISFTS